MVGLRKMEGLVDLHSHVLYGVDDGPRTRDESCALLDGLERLGFDAMVATPHFDNEEAVPNLDTQRRILAEIEARRPQQKPVLYTGAECVFDDRFIGAVRDGSVPRLGNSDVYLVEFGFYPGGVPLGAEEIVRRLVADGFRFVLAHPERLSDLQRETSRVKALVRAGMLLQLDVMSLAGRYGRIAERCAKEMLKESMYTIAATDVHGEEDLEVLEKALHGLFDRDERAFRLLLIENPRQILEGGAKDLMDRRGER